MAASQTLNFSEHDLLDRQPFCKRLEQFILTEHSLVDGGLVVSLNAPFGSGKSHFLKMWVEDLKTRRAKDASLPIPVLINAWESDFCGEPLIALISTLTKTIRELYPQEFEPSKIEVIRDAAKDTLNFSIGVIKQVATTLAGGVDPSAAAKYAQEKRDERNGSNSASLNLLEAFESKYDALAKLKETLGDTFGGDKPKAIIFVDELDRCRPDYAISYLETIKHIFDIHGVIFVLAVDLNQLQSVTESLFGSKLKFNDYYRKFVHRKITLNQPSEVGINKFIENCIKRYFEVKDERKTIFPLTLRDKSYFVDLLIDSQPNSRQVIETFRIMGHLFSTDSNRGSVQDTSYLAMAFLMSHLNVMNYDFFEAVGLKKLSLNDFLLKINGMVKKKRGIQFWIPLVLAHYYPPLKFDGNTILSKLREQMIITDKHIPNKNIDRRENEYAEGLLSSILGGWSIPYDTDKNEFVSLYQKIESIKKIEDQD